MPQNPPRGERNNNPCNIEDFGIPWDGIVGHDGPYLIFKTPEKGIRAGARDVHTKWAKHQLRNVASIITTYAPPSENDTIAYIAAICKELGVGPHEPLNLDIPQNLQKFVTAVIRHECGRVAYSPDLIAEAVKDALANAYKEPSMGFDWSDVQGIVRHVLTTAGGGLVANGYISGQQEQDAVGAIIVLLGIIWSLANKASHRKQLAAAKADASK